MVSSLKIASNRLSIHSNGHWFFTGTDPKCRKTFARHAQKLAVVKKWSVDDMKRTKNLKMFRSGLI